MRKHSFVERAGSGWSGPMRDALLPVLTLLAATVLFTPAPPNEQFRWQAAEA